MRVTAVYTIVVGAMLLALWLYTRENAVAYAVAFVAGGTTVAVVSLLRSPQDRRIDELTRVADALATGRFDARVPATDDALGLLASAINRAAARTEQVVNALRQEQAQLTALLNAGSDAAVAVDRDLSVVYMNEGAQAMFGPAARIGRAFIEVVRDHDLNDVLTSAARHAERSVRVVPYEPAERWLQVTALPIEATGDWAALAVFHDLTEVRRLDSMRRDFISNVSHELRTPLAGIRAAAETLQEGALDDRDAALEFLGHIQRETDRMTQMVEELLELSRIESGAAPMSFRPIDARDLARDAVVRFAQQADRAGLRLSFEGPREALDIYADEERLERAIGNLVANAIRFTPEGGSITVRTEPMDGDVAISVEDTGIGVPADQQARVFERFYKADRGRGETGVGLGLAIVKHIALAHEGTVSVESRPGRGAKFIIRLPSR